MIFKILLLSKSSNRIERDHMTNTDLNVPIAAKMIEAKTIQKMQYYIFMLSLVKGLTKSLPHPLSFDPLFLLVSLYLPMILFVDSKKRHSNMSFTIFIL